MRAALLYLVGAGTTGYGFYQFWHDGTLNQQMFMIGGTCIGAAALLQVAQDLWKRLRR